MATSMSTASLTSQSSLLQSTEDRMLHQLTSQPATKDSSKIEKGAKEFEAMLLTTWLQQAEQSIATVPGAEDDEDAAGREQMMSPVSYTHLQYCLRWSCNREGGQRHESQSAVRWPLRAPPESHIPPRRGETGRAWARI